MKRLIVVLGISVLFLMACAPTSNTTDGILDKDIIEAHIPVFGWSNFNNNENLEDYWEEALTIGEVYAIRMEAVYPCIPEILKSHKFADVQDIISFFKENDFGVCRHRAPVAYWVVKNLYPKSDIKLVIGYSYFLDRGAYISLPGVRGNHVWLQKDGEIIDWTEGERAYHPYVYVSFIEHSEEGAWVSEVKFNMPGIKKKLQDDQAGRAPWDG